MMRRIETILIAVVCAVSFMACSACGGGGSSNPDGPVGKTSQFFLPTGSPRNTWEPHVQVDSQGNLHFVYSAYTKGDAFYGFCTSNCTAADQVKVVQLKNEGTVLNARVALGADNKPQLLLFTSQRVFYATCSGDCTQSASWTMTAIAELKGNFEVSGDAFTVTADGKPRFIMHTTRNLFRTGGTTYYVQCDSDCHNPEKWEADKIADQLWEMGALRLTAAGQPRLVSAEKMSGGVYMSAYHECDSGCTSPGNWRSTPLYRTFSSITEAVPMYSAISLKLNRQGQPRVALIGQDDKGRNLIYLECDANCGTSQDPWNAQVLIPSSEGNTIKAGIDLALDGQDRPRLAYSANFNIVLAFCDSSCTDETKKTWKLAKVEYSADMQKDNIIPYPNCTINGGWFLINPSLALGKDGLPRVAYRAMDVSGGGNGNPGPGETPCAAGPDMTFGRFTQLQEIRAQ